MNLRYVIKELYHQRQRTVISLLGLSIGIALLIILNTLSLAYHEAAMNNQNLCRLNTLRY